MTEIENIKNKVELLLNDDSGGSWNKNHDSDYYTKLNLAKLELLEEDIPSLITTIESQKEEIERLNELTDMQHEQALRDQSKNRRLKAITELAVKGLERIAEHDKEIGCYTSVAMVALSEIERLSHEQNS